MSMLLQKTEWNKGQKILKTVEYLNFDNQNSKNMHVTALLLECVDSKCMFY